MGAFGGAKAQNFLKVLAPVGARKEAFADGGRAKKSDIFSRLLAGWGRRRREKKIRTRKNPPRDPDLYRSAGRPAFSLLSVDHVTI